MMGIMKFSKLIFKNLLNKPATLMYPVKKREFFPLTRGHVKIDIDKCVFCGICAKKCPTNAITVDRNSKTWTIERLRCIVCNSCVENCPKKCLTMENQYTSPSHGSIKEEFHA